MTAVKTIGALIDQLDTIRERKRKLDEQVKTLADEYKEVEAIVIERLTSEETDSGKGKRASASITHEIVADIVDFDELAKYVKKTGYFHLFQRRISNPAFRELAAKRPVPGLAAFTKVKLNLRSITKGA